MPMHAAPRPSRNSRPTHAAPRVGSVSFLNAKPLIYGLHMKLTPVLALIIL